MKLHNNYVIRVIYKWPTCPLWHPCSICSIPQVDLRANNTPPPPQTECLGETKRVKKKQQQKRKYLGLCGSRPLTFVQHVFLCSATNRYKKFSKIKYSPFVMYNIINMTYLMDFNAIVLAYLK